REVTPNHTTCPGNVSMSLLAGIRQRVAETVAGGGGTDPAASATLTSVQYSRTTLAAGQVLQVAFTVRNTGQTTISGQAPSVDLASTDASNAYVYRQNECFDSDGVGSSPPYPKESGRFRVVLGTPDWDAANPGRCVGATGNYPWRWGLNGDLAPGQEQTIVGYVEFFTPGQYTLQAGLVQEYVAYQSREVSPATITVTAEKTAPDAGTFDAYLQPQAQVYRLGATPDSLLQRVGDPLSVERGEYVGSFPWSGEFIDWAAGGPLGLSDQFMIIQTRSFIAPASGVYTFRTISDDGSWLLVDGRQVVNNYGMHPSQPAMGSIQLQAGVHTVGFVYFDRAGFASSGYDVQLPGASGFQLLPDGMSNIPHVGDIFTDYPAPVLVADDAGGSGVATMRWRVNGGDWQDQVGPVVAFGKLQTGRYVFEYQPIDMAGNQGQVRTLSFGVDPQARPSGSNGQFRAFLPLVKR
ncbi:MAG TPA: PA14 domain-containing protein, partial [Roseiflexaceae bacterium]|nr:PA14 domain-containing protein [Roseiflexaceae bacterium]